MNSSWPSEWVGTHLLLEEPGMVDNSWDNIPHMWKEIRFDATDVLFISAFFINIEDKNMMIGKAEDGGSLLERFEWVIRAARSANPNVKIILEQFYGERPDGSDFKIIKDSDSSIQVYATSVATFIKGWYDKTLPSLDGSKQVSARIDGYDIDVEGGTMVYALPKILTAVRVALNTLSQDLGGYPFTVSITPAWVHHLDSSVAKSCDYLNMQNYDGGRWTTPEAYMGAIPGLNQRQMSWGFTSEQPWKNTTQTFDEVKAKAQEVADGQWAGVYTWRINSNNYAYENIFQVWLYNFVHGTSLPNSKPEHVVAKYWVFGGREGSEEGRPLSDAELR